MKILLPVALVFFLALASYAQSTRVTLEKTSLRAAPSAKAKVIKVLAENTDVRVVRRNGAWLFVRSGASRGWLSRKSVYIPPPDIISVKNSDRLTVLGDADSNAPVSGARVMDLSDKGGSAASTGTLPKTITGGLLNGKATSLPKPAYPAAAKALHAGGSVTVQVLIDESGKVISASAVSGHPLLRASAVSAAQASTFTPTLLQGQPVKVSGVITYNFIAAP